VISWQVLAIDPMLIQSFVGVLDAQLVERAFGFGSAKARSIGLRLLLRLISHSALLESLQVDHIPHAGLHQADNGGQEAISRWPLWPHRALKRFSVSGNPVDLTSTLSIAIASVAKPTLSFAERPLVGSAIMNSP
jgi:hypothetical protein